jgi:hypothetical protein
MCASLLHIVHNHFDRSKKEKTKRNAPRIMSPQRRKRKNEKRRRRKEEGRKNSTRWKREGERREKAKKGPGN